MYIYIYREFVSVNIIDLSDPLFFLLFTRCGKIGERKANAFEVKHRRDPLRFFAES